MNVGLHRSIVKTESGERIEKVSPTLRLALPFSERRLLLVVIDALFVNLAFGAALWLWARMDDQTQVAGFVRLHWFWFPLFTTTWWGLAWLENLYAVPTAARRVETAARILIVLLMITLGYLVIYFLLPRNVLPRLFFLFFLATAMVGLTLWRWTYTTLFRLPQLSRRVLIVGAGWAGQTLAQTLEKRKSSNYRAVGFVDDDPNNQGKTIARLPVLGGSEQLVELVSRLGIDEVVVAITHGLRSETFQALMDCRANKVHISRMPDLYEQLEQRVPVEHINEGWILEALNGRSMSGYLEQAIRTLIDLLLGGVGLIVLGLILPWVAFLIYFDDRGPVFYTQTRSGLGGKPFRVIKFRTMRQNAEQDGQPRWAQENDNRVTRVGRFLRKVRLDELPQVINILRGEMSVVGPRPERPEFIAELEKKIPFYRARLVVKPGLTGWAQINYEYGNSIQDALIKLQYDLYYIRHRSIWLDLYTIFQTVGVVLRGGGM